VSTRTASGSRSARPRGTRAPGLADLAVRCVCQKMASRPRTWVKTSCERAREPRSSTRSTAAPRRRHRRTGSRSTTSTSVGHGSSKRWQYTRALDGQVVADARLAAPALVAWETANIIRRHELAGIVGFDQAAQAHADLLELAIEFWPHDLLAGRAWNHRQNLSIYDASYVALAEMLQTDLVTLDRRIAGAPGLTCSVLTP
jgi:predicted nucleic acid-binding protein